MPVPATSEQPPPPPDAAAVADAYGLGRPLGPPVAAARGELGRIWRLETLTGTWAVKEIFEPDTEAEAGADVAFQEAALAAGIPMPRPIRARGGTVLAEVDAADRRATVRVYTWVDIAQPVRRAAATDAAAILGRLHALAIPDPRTMNAWFTDAVTAERWRGILAATELADAAWAPTLANLVPELVAGEPLIAAGRHEPRITCHMDFNPENVLTDIGGRAVVVDWENSGPAAAEQELASVLAEFVPDPAGVPAFLHAYEDAGGPAHVRDGSSFAMCLAFQAELVAWYAERAIDPKVSAEDQARAVHWIGDIAANVFTPARIDRWLAASASRGG
jgi:Ser/Thr protein kinase RdoA (MazF antagonist)